MSPWLFAFAHGIVGVDTWVSAILVATISFVALVTFQAWEEWINLILGVWISASPWVLGFQHTVAMRINLGVDILIVYLAVLELWLIHYGPSSEKYPTTTNIHRRDRDFRDRYRPHLVYLVFRAARDKSTVTDWFGYLRPNVANILRDPFPIIARQQISPSCDINPL